MGKLLPTVRETLVTLGDISYRIREDGTIREVDVGQIYCSREELRELSRAINTFLKSDDAKGLQDKEVDYRI